jgi:hypothetical protein
LAIQEYQTKDSGTNCVNCERYKSLGEVCVIEHGKKFLWEFCRDFQPEVVLPNYEDLMRTVRKEISTERKKMREKRKRELLLKRKQREEKRTSVKTKRIFRKRTLVKNHKLEPKIISPVASKIRSSNVRSKFSEQLGKILEKNSTKEASERPLINYKRKSTTESQPRTPSKGLAKTTLQGTKRKESLLKKFKRREDNVIDSTEPTKHVQEV